MADDSLKTPVSITAIGIAAASLPPGFSGAFKEYTLSQAADFSKVAQKANSAGEGAYEAQQKNEEQDEVLANHEQRLDSAEATLANHETRITAAEVKLEDHETRITANEAELANHETRITQNESDIQSQGNRLTTAEGKISTLQTDVSGLKTRVTTAEGNITQIQGDYVSKSTTASQEIQSSLSIQTSLSVNGVKIIGPQQTGWTASTGTANKGAFNADASFTVSDPPTQAEVQAIVTALVATRQRTKALEDMARNHGLIA